MTCLSLPLSLIRVKSVTIMLDANVSERDTIIGRMNRSSIAEDQYSVSNLMRLSFIVKRDGDLIGQLRKERHGRKKERKKHSLNTPPCATPLSTTLLDTLHSYTHLPFRKV